MCYPDHLTDSSVFANFRVRFNPSKGLQWVMSSSGSAEVVSNSGPCTRYCYMSFPRQYFSQVKQECKILLKLTTGYTKSWLQSSKSCLVCHSDSVGDTLSSFLMTADDTLSLSVPLTYTKEFLALISNEECRHSSQMRSVC